MLNMLLRNNVKDLQRQVADLQLKLDACVKNSPATKIIYNMPQRTDAMFVYEDWKTSVLYNSSSVDPARRWISANSPDDNHANEQIGDFNGQKVLDMALVPDDWGYQCGSRVFWTNSGRWDTLNGLSKVWFRYFVYLNELPIVDEGTGNEGKWATLGLQMKDNGATLNALVQVNARTNKEGQLEAVLQMADGNVTSKTPFYYPKQQYVQVNMDVTLKSDKTGVVNLYFDKVLAFTSLGRTLDTVGRNAGWGLAFYSNALRQPSNVFFGGVIASKEAIV